MVIIVNSTFLKPYDTNWFHMAVGGLISGRLSDNIGRRMTIALACILFIAGSILMACARTYSVLMSGRIITGR